MRRILLLPAAVAAAFLTGCREVPYTDPLASVNPLIATCDTPDADLFNQLEPGFRPHANSRCTPGALTPFGMVNTGPVTRHIGDTPPGYDVHDTTVTGFAFMRTSGSGWAAEFGNLLTMATTGPLQTCYGQPDGSFPGYRSIADKSSETARPGYYSIRLKDNDILTECTASPHCGALRFTFPESDLSRIQCDLAFRITGSSARQHVEVVDDSTFTGWMKYTPQEGGWGNGRAGIRYTLYFHAVISRPLEQVGFWKADVPDGMLRRDEQVNSPAYLQLLADAQVLRDTGSCTGNCIGFFTEFPTRAGEEVLLKVGFSFVDAEGARKNYEAEARGKGFDRIRNEAAGAWRQALGSVRTRGGTEDEKAIFYTGLYHTMVDPRSCTDVDGRFTGGDGQIHTATDYTRRTLFSGWDVFRSQFPLQTLIHPRLVDDLLNSQIDLAEETGRGYFNRWEMLGAYTGCMLGNPTVSVLADAYSKGIRGYDAGKALRIAVRSGDPPAEGLSVYPDEMVMVSVVLENAYFDWCAGRLAAQLGKPELADSLFAKSRAWQDWFRPDLKWFYPKDAQGNWRESVPDWLTRPFFGTCESNLLQQGWFVPHDLDAFAGMLGGRDSTLARLDDFFARTRFTYGWDDYYLHGNEPVHWVPFYYNRLGAPWKTQQWTRTILRKCYTNDVEGLTGNEDEGQLSAWYVLTACGLHQICPGDGRVEILAPLFREVVFTLDPAYYPGGSFTIRTHGDPARQPYIRKARLNGRPLRRCWLDFHEITDGGRLDLWLGSDPDPDWGSEPPAATP